MKKTLLFGLFLIAISLQSQTLSHVIILNEGHYDYVNSIQTVPVTIGSYNPVTHIYTPFDTIQNARFATNVLVDGNYIYAAADSFLIQYDKTTLQRVNMQIVRGIRKMAVWNNQLLLSRGEYLMTFNSYVQIYDKNSLAFIYELNTSSGPQFASENIVVKNDIAYIGINNGFDFGNETGLVGKINLLNQSYIGEIDLGPNGKNPENMMLLGNKIYTVNNRDYTTGSVSELDVINSTTNTVALGTSSGCGASTLGSGYVYYQVSMDTKLTRFSTTTLSNYDTININRNIYGMAFDAINSVIYSGTTDFTTSGWMFRSDAQGTLIDSFQVGVAPGNIAFDINSGLGINSLQNESINILQIISNPVSQTLQFINKSASEIPAIYIHDISGKLISVIKNVSPGKNEINISTIQGGIYFLSSSLNEAEKEIKFILIR